MATKRKWIQSAVKRMKRKATVGSYGHKTVKQMKRDKARGGAIGKKANFALNVRKANRGKKKTARKVTRRKRRVSKR